MRMNQLSRGVLEKRQVQQAEMPAGLVLLAITSARDKGGEVDGSQ